ncbi:MAG: YraN family protein [Candidatus Paceibacterota bacterium]
MTAANSNHKLQLGQIGESIAQKYLISKKYKILDKNYFLKTKTNRKLGEIDLIAKKGSVYVFIEVKTIAGREGRRFPPAAKINRVKIKKLIRVGESWLKNHKLSLTVRWQIDIITIEIDIIRKKALVRHYENAIEDIKK